MGKQIANVYLHRGRLPRALHLYFESLNVFRKLGRKKDVAETLSNIGLVHWLQDNLSLAREYFFRTIQHYESVRGREGEASAFNNLANVFVDQKAYDRALRYYKQALEIHEKQGDGRGKALVHHNIGVVLIAQERHRKALDYLFRALAIKKTLGNAARIFPTYEEIAHAYLGMKAYDEALRYAQKSLTFATEHGDLRPLMASTQMLSKIYAAMGRYERAYTYQSRYVAAKDSLLTVEKAQAVARLQQQYEARQNAQALRILRQQQHVQELQAQATRNRLLGGLAAALLLIGFFYNRSRLKQKANRRLKIQKEEVSRKGDRLQQALKEKELLVKEIHHRVKNNLQVVSSLLSIQSYMLAGGEALDAVQDVHHRVEAMALVHKKLYRSEDLAEIDAQDYLWDLSHYLLQAYQGDTPTVDCRVRAQGITLDMDTAIPLGLIAGELISNALEHAFPGARRGEITVALQRKPGGGYALTITDDGVGLPVHAGDGGMAGMGLPLVQKLTRQLQGTLERTSGAGTTFTVTFGEAAFGEPV